MAVVLLKFHESGEGVVLGLRKQVLDAFETDIAMDRHSLTPIGAINIITLAEVHGFALWLG